MTLIIRVLLVFITCAVTANSPAASQVDDIRILIDVSGSMKKTDPSNLRTPAMMLINGLIPSGSKAGVWTFGRYVNMTVKWGTVDDRWRHVADKGADTIHSNALYTNIEKVLRDATKDWNKPDPASQRSIILLTDGQVDISKDPSKSQASREAILQTVIPMLKGYGAKVHAIALSHNADEILLKRLALETGGSFEVVETANGLQRVFVKMFERATVPDTVMFEGNEFKIDSSVQEMTLLIFREAGSEPTELFLPNHESISASSPGDSTWRSDGNYDLISVKNPKSGVWRVEAMMDPDNRVMVVTDLQLDVSGLPSYLIPSQPVDITAMLQNKNAPIKKNSFLRFVEFNLQYGFDDGEKSEIKMTASSDRETKGQYQYSFVEGLEEGSHSILISADSRTFNRSLRYDVKVQWPIKVSIKPTTDPGNFELKIEAREEYLRPDTLLPSVTLISPDNNSQVLELGHEDNLWHTDIETSQNGLYKALIHFEAEMLSGDPVSLDTGAYLIHGIFKDEPESQPQDAQEDLAHALATDAESAAKREPNQIDWVNISIILGVTNLLLLLLVGGGVYMWRRRAAGTSTLSIDEAQIDD